MLSSQERNRLAEAIETWADSVSDEPVIGFLGENEFWTPSQLVTHVRSETPEGNALLEILEHGVRREGIEKVIERLTSPTDEILMT